jgi:hypothetical protein
LQVAGAVQESYYFKVNGLPIYFKGANVIPLSILPSNVTAELTHSILEAAVESNQNLLRVWGGGLYHVSAAGDRQHECWFTVANPDFGFPAVTNSNTLSGEQQGQDPLQIRASA